MATALAYSKFLEEQEGVYPPTFAAIFLDCTLQNLDYLARSGGLKYFKVGRNKLYGWKSMMAHRWSSSRKFHDNGSRIRRGPGASVRSSKTANSGTKSKAS
ncbi:MAG: hypothetical protein O3A87_01220 [Verrucomicrobia bacterium]|nr:hypothetical protein [Verrucomicrobiota bacterium]MDA1005090.1 hypothetical protein [Verrucomicrobiota bacterium]